MRTLWNAVSFVAVVNLLALGMLVAWMWHSQRLSMDRLHSVRELFAQAVPVAAASAAEREAARTAERERARQEWQKTDPPLDSESQIQQVSILGQQEEQARRRLQDERNILLAQIDAAADRLERQRADFERQRAEWEQTVSADRKRKVDEQFSQTVRQYEQVPPKQGKAMLLALVESKQVDMAVAYLDAMNARSAGKILREFKTEPEIALATQLLEKLRSFGMEGTGQAAPESKVLSNAPSARDTAGTRQEDQPNQSDDVASAQH